VKCKSIEGLSLGKRDWDRSLVGNSLLWWQGKAYGRLLG